jgi:hypothetical protein
MRSAKSASSLRGGGVSDPTTMTPRRLSYSGISPQAARASVPRRSVSMRTISGSPFPSSRKSGAMARIAESGAQTTSARASGATSSGVP